MKKKKPLSLRAQTKGFDKLTLAIVLGLVVFGVVMVFNTSVVEAEHTFGDKFFFVKRQLAWALIGFGLLGLFSKTPYQLLQKVATPLFLCSIALLILVLMPGLGTSTSGASRWIDLGVINLQPSELAKLSLVIFLAYVLAKGRSILYLLAAVIVTAGLVVIEPDLGTAVVIVGISGVMYFVSGAPLWRFLLLVPAVVVAGLGLILTSEYRRERLLTFLDPNIDPLGTSYHIRQILIALGSGGIFGVGLGHSRQKYLFVPEPMTDSIFAIIGEELGFVGTTVVLLAFVFLLWRGLTIALDVADPFGRLLAAGIVTWIGIQTFVNLGAMVALLPLTGIPLPFLSYGGSSLVVTLAAMGIFLNVSRSRQVSK